MEQQPNSDLFPRLYLSSMVSNDFSINYVFLMDFDNKSYYWIFLLILCILPALGLFSIGLKKYIEERKNIQVIQQVILPLQLNLQEPENSQNQSCFNTLKFNKPLLSLKQITVFAVLFCIAVSIHIHGSWLYHGGFYLHLIIDITMDFVLPLLYSLNNKDYRKHTKNALVDTFRSVFWKKLLNVYMYLTMCM